MYAAETVVCRIYDRAHRSGNQTVELHGSTLTLPVERRFASVDAMQRYVDACRALRWVQHTWTRAQVPVTVRDRRGQAKAHYERTTATIAIPPHERNTAWAMRELVLLHELAHHLAPDGLAEPHGPQFADRYLVLVREIIGPEAGLLLQATMHEVGVRIGVPNQVRL